MQSKRKKFHRLNSHRLASHALKNSTQPKRFHHRNGTAALEDARKAEAEIARGEWKGPLHGIPLAVKDLVETAGVKTTAASAVLQRQRPHR